MSVLQIGLYIYLFKINSVQLLPNLKEAAKRCSVFTHTDLFTNTDQLLTTDKNQQYLSDSQLTQAPQPQADIRSTPTSVSRSQGMLGLLQGVFICYHWPLF